MHTGLDSRMADVDQEDIDGRLGRANHVLSGRDELNNRVIELGTGPPVTRLVARLVPVEQLGYLVRHVAHTTPPSANTFYSTPTDEDNYQRETSTHRFPPSMNWTYGLIYVLQRLHLAITVSPTTGTASSPSFKLRYGAKTSANGILDLANNDAVVGIAFNVQRWYEGSEFALGEGDKHELGGSRISGGGRCSSRGSGGDVRRFVVCNENAFCPAIPPPMPIPPNWPERASTGCCPALAPAPYTG